MDETVAGGRTGCAASVCRARRTGVVATSRLGPTRSTRPSAASARAASATRASAELTRDATRAGNARGASANGTCAGAARARAACVSGSGSA
jgi:hypothetical protein